MRLVNLSRKFRSFLRYTPNNYFLSYHRTSVPPHPLEGSVFAIREFLPNLMESRLFQHRMELAELNRTYSVSFSSIRVRRRVRRSGRLTAWGRFLRFQNRLLLYFRSPASNLRRHSAPLSRPARSGSPKEASVLLRQDTLLMGLGFCFSWYQAYLACPFSPLSLDGRVGARTGLWCGLGAVISINPLSFLGRLFYFHRFQRQLRGNVGFLKAPPCMEFDARTYLHFVYRTPLPDDFSGNFDLDLDAVFMFGGRR